MKFRVERAVPPRPPRAIPAHGATSASHPETTPSDKPFLFGNPNAPVNKETRSSREGKGKRPGGVYETGFESPLQPKRRDVATA